MGDERVVARQLGRQPRGRWRAAARCSFGSPTVIATAPVTEAGEPFPTLFYLTCPHLAEAVSALESSGEIERWRQRVAENEELRARLLEADARYRAARAGEAGGVDPLPEVGIAGQRDPLALKCLHARVAAAVAGIGDPIGEAVLEQLERECAGNRCGEDNDGRA